MPGWGCNPAAWYYTRPSRAKKGYGPFLPHSDCGHSSIKPPVIRTVIRAINSNNQDFHYCILFSHFLAVQLYSLFIHWCSRGKWKESQIASYVRKIPNIKFSFVPSKHSGVKEMFNFHFHLTSEGGINEKQNGILSYILKIKEKDDWKRTDSRVLIFYLLCNFLVVKNCCPERL